MVTGNPKSGATTPKAKEQLNSNSNIEEQESIRPVISSAIEDSIDTIREILGGDLSIALNKKFSILEQRLDRELQLIREQHTHAIEVTEQWIKQEINALRAALNTELSEHRTLRESGLGDLRAASKDLETRFSQASQDVGAQLRDIREQVTRQARTLSAELAQRNQAIQREFERSLSEFEVRKTDRMMIAGLLRRMARTLELEPTQETSTRLQMEQKSGQVIGIRPEEKKKSG